MSDEYDIIKKIKLKNPDAVILVQTLYNPGFESINPVYQQGADRLNAGYRKYIAEHRNAYELKKFFVKIVDFVNQFFANNK